ncbi:MAG: Gfo/Idh/MocA family oxidoreductase [Lentisphaeria bacterium]|nr:Gfo/Idh/MocA family oxidoreductase [Lentisphaeria bacterium]
MDMRFGLVGLGYHGQHAVLPSFDEPAAAGVKLTAVCDVCPANLDYVTLPVEKYLSAQEMIAKAPIDAVYVAVGCDQAKAIVLAVLAAGKAVICEKPLAETAAEARLIADEVQKSGALFAVNFETRYGQRMQLLKRWIDGGYLGKIQTVGFDKMWDCHKSFTETAPRRARLLSLIGGLDCGIHQLDQAQYLLGGSWKKVRAMGAWFDEDFIPPPHISIVGMLDNDLVVSLNASLAFTSNIEPREGLDNVVIAGTEGVAVVRKLTSAGTDSEAVLTSRTLCEKVTIPQGGHSSDIALLLTEFARVWRNGPETPHTFAGAEDGYQAQLATELAIQDALENAGRKF